jgi:hypothetical protein
VARGHKTRPSIYNDFRAATRNGVVKFNSHQITNCHQRLHVIDLMAPAFTLGKRFKRLKMVRRNVFNALREAAH